MSSMMPRGYGIGPSGKLGPLQPPAAGRGAGNSGGYAPAPGMGGGMPAAPMPASPTGGMPMPPAGGFGGGGESVDTGGLPSGPGSGGGGFSPTTYSPTFGGDTTNITNRTYDNSSRNYDMSRRNTYNQQKTNIDNSQTTMAARGGQGRKKIERMRPFQQKDYGMGEQMIGNPGLAVQQLKMMNSLMGLG